MFRMYQGNVLDWTSVRSGFAVMGDTFGGLALGWQPSKGPATIASWTVVTESSGMTEYLFDQDPMAPLVAYWLSENIDKVGPVVAAKLVGALGVRRLADLCQNQDPQINKVSGAKLQASSIEHLYRLAPLAAWSTTSVAEDLPAVRKALQTLGHAPEKISAAIARCRASEAPMTISNVLGQLQ